ncbi:hypothetical protein HWV62_20606 [Athelia sp. TMB]|nr:hypothetical protein HWV62_20606 [Athelia sp. TMB]
MLLRLSQPPADRDGVLAAGDRVAHEPLLTALVCTDTILYKAGAFDLHNAMGSADPTDFLNLPPSPCALEDALWIGTPPANALPPPETASLKVKARPLDEDEDAPSKRPNRQAKLKAKRSASRAGVLSCAAAQRILETSTVACNPSMNVLDFPHASMVSYHELGS